MADPREELAALRRMAELEDKFKAYRSTVSDVPQIDSAGNVINVQPPAPEQTMYQQARPYIKAGLTTGMPMAGGLIGTAVGPMGTALGAAGGYMGAEALMRGADVAAGLRKQPSLQGIAAEDIGNLGAGGLMELGGALVGKLIGKGAAATADFFNPQVRAGNILREAAKGKEFDIKNALVNAPQGSIPAEALASANVPVPTLQAILNKARGFSPEVDNALLARAQNIEAQNKNLLAQMASGGTQTERLAAQEEFVKNLRNAQLPERETALNRANIAGELTPQLQALRESSDVIAGKASEDVRKWEAAAERGRARRPYPEPNVEGSFPFASRVTQRAEEEAQKAADTSMLFAQGRVTADEAMKAMENQGLKPLKADPIISKIDASMRDPKNQFAGSKETQNAANYLKQQLTDWSNEHGFIDAYALESIKKNAVNSHFGTIAGGGAPLDKQSAERLMSKLNPMINDAIEQAGGKGYKDYLAAYSRGMDEVNQSKLLAHAADLWEKGNTKEFRNLVEGNNPDKVAEFMGPGRHDISKEISGSDFSNLKNLADQLKVQDIISEQAGLSKAGASKVVKEGTEGKFLPPSLNLERSIINKTLDILTGNVNKKTLDTLAKASTDNAQFLKTMNALPAKERVTVINALTNAQSMGGFGAAGLAPIKNALTPANNRR